MRLPRLRLLPVVIVAAAFLLSMKIGALWQEGGQAIAATGAADAGSSPTMSKAAAAADTSGKVAAAAPKPSSSGSDGDDDPVSSAAANCTADEMAALQKVQKQRADLDKRSGVLDQKELLLKAMEAQLNDKITTLHQKQAELDHLLGKVDEQSDQRLKSLVKIYETMKPADAARILDQMDTAMLLQLLDRMKESKSAPILAAMNPDHAKLVTIAMASKQAVPADLKAPAGATN